MKSKGKVMLVDDDQDFLAANQLLLERNGYEVSVASEAADCVEKARAEKPDAIVLDLLWSDIPKGVPTVYGLQACQETQNIPILLVSNVFDRLPCFREADEFWSLVEGVLRKPVAPQQLLGWVNQMVERKPSVLRGN
jgi:twitching motility two-component system response regulator PilH